MRGYKSILILLVLSVCLSATAQSLNTATNVAKAVKTNMSFAVGGDATTITNAPYYAGGIPTFNRNWSHDLNTTNAATTVFPFGLVRASAGAGNSLFTTNGFISARTISAGNSYYLLAPTNKGGIRRIEVKGRWMYTNDGGLDQQKHFNVSISKVSMDDGDGTFGLNGPNLHINPRSFSLSVDINTNGLNQYTNEGWLPYNYTGIDPAKYITNGQEFIFILDFPADNEMVIEHMGETRKITLNYLTNITRSAFCWLEFLHDGVNGWVEISDFRYYNASFLTPSGPNESNSVVSVGGAQNPPVYRDSIYSGSFYGGAPSGFGITNGARVQHGSGSGWMFLAQANGDLIQSNMVAGANIVTWSSNAGFTSDGRNSVRGHVKFSDGNTASAGFSFGASLAGAFWSDTTARIRSGVSFADPDTGGLTHVDFNTAGGNFFTTIYANGGINNEDGLTNFGVAIFGGIATFTNGVATLRSNKIAPVAFTFPATTVNWTNPLNCNIEVYIDNTGVTGTQLAKNGSQIAVLPLFYSFGLQPGEFFSETYTIGTPSAKFSPR